MKKSVGNQYICAASYCLSGSSPIARWQSRASDSQQSHQSERQAKWWSEIAGTGWNPPGISFPLVVPSDGRKTLRENGTCLTSAFPISLMLLFCQSNWPNWHSDTQRRWTAHNSDIHRKGFSLIHPLNITDTVGKRRVNKVIWLLKSIFIHGKACSQNRSPYFPRHSAIFLK